MRGGEGVSIIPLITLFSDGRRAGEKKKEIRCFVFIYPFAVDAISPSATSIKTATIISRCYASVIRIANIVGAVTREKDTRDIS